MKQPPHHGGGRRGGAGDIDKCGKCDTIFEAAIDEYVVKGKQSALHSKLHTT